MKRLVLNAILALSFISLANASEVDILATLTNGKISDTSAGVRVLSLDEEKEVLGGYKIAYAMLQNFSLGRIQVKEMAAVVLPDVYNEILTKGLCSLGQTSCYLSANTHYSFNSNRYRELEREADPLKGEYLAFTIKRTTSYVIPYKPTLQYTTGASVVGITSSGSIYRIRNANTNNALVREMRSLLQNKMKNAMGFN